MIPFWQKAAGLFKRINQTFVEFWNSFWYSDGSISSQIYLSSNIWILFPGSTGWRVITRTTNSLFFYDPYTNPQVLHSFQHHLQTPVVDLDPSLQSTIDCSPGWPCSPSLPCSSDSALSPGSPWPLGFPPAFAGPLQSPGSSCPQLESLSCCPPWLIT